MSTVYININNASIKIVNILFIFAECAAYLGRTLQRPGNLLPGAAEVHSGHGRAALTVHIPSLHLEEGLSLKKIVERLSFIPTRKCPQTTQPDPIIRKKQGATRPLLLLSKPYAPQGMTATAI